MRAAATPSAANAACSAAGAQAVNAITNATNTEPTIFERIGSSLTFPLIEDRLDVRLEHIAETKRRVLIEATGPRSRARLEKLADAFSA